MPGVGPGCLLGWDPEGIGGLRTPRLGPPEAALVAFLRRPGGFYCGLLLFLLKEKEFPPFK